MLYLSTARTIFRPTAQGIAHLRLPLRKINNFRCQYISLKADGLPADFSFYPEFFSVDEQRLLLNAALQKLDMVENRQVRRRQRELLASRMVKRDSSIEEVFLPDQYYSFLDVITQVTSVQHTLSKSYEEHF